MNSQRIDANTQAPSRVVYTCWPFGGLLCGVATIGIGALLLAEHYLDAAPEVLWGVGLIVLGGAVVLRTRNRDAW
jgi:MYXO-CTERM domain-containing protein